MENKEIYTQLYKAYGLPIEFEEYLFPVFEKVVETLKNKLLEVPAYKRKIDLNVCLRYLAEEHMYNMSMMNKEYMNKFMNFPEYTNHLYMIVCDKIFFNEYLEYKSSSIISKYNPLISALTLFLNFVLNKFEQIPKQMTDLGIALKLDILRKGFFMTKSILTLLCDGFETEAFSTWRTLHEIECVAQTINNNENLAKVYYEHIQYNKLYRSTEKNETIDKFYEHIKLKLKEHNLKSKDFKKYLEYGWLYSIIDWKEKYPEMKLNFRKGIQYVAGLSQYSDIYEASSEIAHGSSLLVYSNKDYYCNLTLICLYETFMRMENIFSKIISTMNEVDSSAYFKMKEIYIEELSKNLVKLKVMTEIKKARKKQVLK